MEKCCWIQNSTKMLTIFNINLYERNATIFISEHYSPLTGCLACILLAYWLFISTYEAHINALFCMTMDQLHNGPWEKKKIIIMTLFNDSSLLGQSSDIIDVCALLSSASEQGEHHTHASIMAEDCPGREEISEWSHYFVLFAHKSILIAL